MDESRVGLFLVSSVLISKVNRPQRVIEYRPISLCNMMYKMAAKTLANRLKKILPAIISDI